MSLAYYISLQDKNPGFDTFVNGKSLAHACDHLDEIAIKLGITPIGDFYGRKWYSPDVGLQSVGVLIQYLNEHPDVIPETQDVVDDLREWEEVLVKAKEAGIKWKMKIDY